MCHSILLPYLVLAGMAGRCSLYLILVTYSCQCVLALRTFQDSVAHMCKCSQVDAGGCDAACAPAGGDSGSCRHPDEPAGSASFAGMHPHAAGITRAVAARPTRQELSRRHSAGRVPESR